MITYHEISGVLRKMTVLDSHIHQLRQMMAEFAKLSGKIKFVNDDLAVDRERFDCEIRSVELLQEILKKEVFDRPDRIPVDPLRSGSQDGTSVEPGSIDDSESSRVDVDCPPPSGQ